MSPDEIIEDMKSEFLGGHKRKARKYVGGLLPSICELLLELDTPSNPYASFAAFIADYPLIDEGTSQLTVQTGAGKKTIRPAYNLIERYYVFEHKRLDYPRSAPYATGKWADYTRWIDSLVGFSREQIEDIRDRTKAFVLETLKPVLFDPASVVIEPPVFKMLLEDFDFADRARGEPTGAAFQAMVFGYIRADAPHLQVEARKVRTGSARLKGIGDIDAWEADRLIITAEVKHYVFPEAHVASLEHFAHEVQQRAALGMVVAVDFEEGVRESLEAIGLVPVSLADLLVITRLWDPVKQRNAVNAFQWVVVHKEQNTGLMGRVDEFFYKIGYKEKPTEAVEAMRAVEADDGVQAAG